MSNKIPQAEKDLVPYLETLGLHSPPFSAESRPAKPFIDPEWQQYLHQILHLVQTSDLILAIVGEKGLGKTTLINMVIDNLPDNIRHCMIRIEANQGAQGLLNQWAECLDLPHNLQPAAMLPLIDEQAALLRRYDQILLLVLDDAHLLSPEALNMLRYMQEGSEGREESLPWRILLSVDPAHMTQFMLYGEKIHFIQLAPFTEKQTEAYLLHRLRNAGLQGELPLSGQEIEFIHKISKGIPAEMHALAHARLLGLDEIPTLSSTSPPSAHEELPQREPDIPAVLHKDINTNRPRRSGMMILSATILALVLVAVFFQGQINSLFQGTPGDSTQQQAVREKLQLPEQQEYLLKSIPYPVPRISTPRINTPGISTPVVQATEPTQTEAPTGQARSDSTAIVPPTLTAAPEQAMQATAEPEKISPVEKTPESKTAISTPTESAVEKTTTTHTSDSKAESIHDKEWVLQQNPKHFTLQLMGSSTLSAVENIASSPRLRDQASVYKIMHNEQDWYVLLYGVYNSRADAKTAISKLPASLRKNTPWIRPYADIQQEIRVGKK